MPSKTAKQKRFMAACAHGADYASCPPKKVSREYNMADKRKDDKAGQRKKAAEAKAKKAAKAVGVGGLAGKLRDKYSGYAEGGLVTRSGPVADWLSAGRKVRDYIKKGKRSTR
jgi:hypothetical protein